VACASVQDERKSAHYSPRRKNRPWIYRQEALEVRLRCRKHQLYTGQRVIYMYTTPRISPKYVYIRSAAAVPCMAKDFRLSAYLPVGPYPYAFKPGRLRPKQYSIRYQRRVKLERYATQWVFSDVSLLRYTWNDDWNCFN